MAGRGDIKAGRAYVELFTKDSSLVSGLNAASARLKSFGNSVMALGRTISAVRSAALIPLGISLKVFADFDDKMREVKAVSGSTAEEFQRLTAVAKELGRTTSFTAAEVGGLMGELGRAGFSAKEIENATGAVLDLARATAIDATLASGIMAATIRQFSLTAKDSVRVADALTMAANASFNSVESLGEAMKYAGPVALDFNMSLEETLAILGVLGNLGIQGSSAGTALRGLLTATGADAEKLQEIFGVTFKDAAGNARPLVQVLDEINEATKHLGTADRAEKFNAAFGLLRITAASAISKSAESAGELLEKIEGASGVARKTAEEMDAGLGGSFRKFLSAAEGAAIAIGNALTGSVQTFVDKATAAAGVVTEWIDKNQSFVLGIAKAIWRLGAVATAITAVGAGLVGLGAVLGGTATALTTIGTVAGFVFSPAGVLTIAIAAAAIELGRFFSQMDTLKTFMAERFSAAVGTVVESLGALGEALALGDVEQAFRVATIGIELMWVQLLDSLKDGYVAFLGGLVDATEDRLKSAFSGKKLAARITAVLVGAPIVGGLLADAATRAPGAVGYVADTDFRERQLRAQLAAERAKMQARLEDRSRPAIKDLAEEAVSFAGAAWESRWSAGGFADSGPLDLRDVVSAWEDSAADVRTDLQRLIDKQEAARLASMGADKYKPADDLGPEIVARIEAADRELAALLPMRDEAPLRRAGEGLDALATGAGVTFSAAAALAMGQGSGPLERVAKASEASARQMRELHETNKLMLEESRAIKVELAGGFVA